MRKLGFVPRIFAVSARNALLARTTGLDKERLWRDSKFGPLEEQINSIVTEAGGRTLKLRSACQSGQLMLDELTGELQASLAVIARDEAKLERVELFLQTRKDQTLRQVGGLLRGVEQACRDGAAEGARLLSEKLSFSQTWKILLGRTRWQREFQSEIETKLQQSVQQQVENAVQLLETDLRSLWPQLHDIIEQQLISELKSQIPYTLPDFARQRRELLQSIQLALSDRVSGKTIEEHLGRLFSETSARLRLPAGVAAAGGIAAAVAAMTSAAVADVTGMLAASAAIVGAIVAVRQRRKILRVYEQEMEAKGCELMQTIEQQLKHAAELFYKDISAAFQSLAVFCVTQRQTYEPLLNRAKELQQTFNSLKSRLG